MHLKCEPEEGSMVFSFLAFKSITTNWYDDEHKISPLLTIIGFEYSIQFLRVSFVVVILDTEKLRVLRKKDPLSSSVIENNKFPLDERFMSCILYALRLEIFLGEKLVDIPLK